MSNLTRHINNIKKFGLPVIVAINHFVADTDKEMKTLQEECNKINVEAVLSEHWSKGGEGAINLAKKVVEIVEQKNSFKFLYDNKTPLIDKIKTIAREIYDADDIVADKKIRDQLKQFENEGYSNFPICIAKTQYSFSTDPTLKGAPSNHTIPIREVRLSSGAEFIVVVCGEIMTMPGLPSVPAANSIHLNDNGEIEGLF
jgi:formate--tetrahydrofolate ligase